MDEKRSRSLVQGLRKTGKLFNEVGAQYWHTDKGSDREDRAIW